MLKMVMILPEQKNAELVAEIMTALAHMRYDNAYEKEYTEKLEPNHDGKNYFIEGEYVTLEMVDVIEDIKKILPLETYCEAGEKVEWEVDGHDELERGDICNNAIASLYVEKEHDRWTA